MEKRVAPPPRRLSGGDIARRAGGRETRDSRQDAGATFFHRTCRFYPMCLEVLALSKRLLKADG